MSREEIRIYFKEPLAPGTYSVTVTNPAASGGLTSTLAGGFVIQ